MLYRFKSRATADVVMVQPEGDRVLAALGREPSAQGVFTVEQMPAAIARLEAAIQAEKQRPAAPPAGGAAPDAAGDTPSAEASADEGVDLGRRAWPLLQALREAHAAGVDLVWGV